MMVDLMLLLQAQSAANPTAEGIFHFFAGLILILFLYTSFLGFTYWISKDE